MVKMSVDLFARARTREQDGYHCIAALAAGTCTSQVSVIHSCAEPRAQTHQSHGCYALAGCWRCLDVVLPALQAT